MKITNLKIFSIAFFILNASLTTSMENNYNQNHLNKKLIKAIENYKFHKIISLVRSGANINITDSKGQTALMKVILFDLKVSEYLIKKGININAQDKTGYTALMFAAFWNSKSVKLLIKHGAQPNIRSKQGVTALMLAANWRPVSIGYLILAGADLNQIKNKNAIQYHNAANIQNKINLLFNLLKNYKINRSKIDELFSWLKNQDLLDLIRDNNQNTLLHCTVLNNDKIATIKLLILYPYLADTINRKGKTPIDLAFENFAINMDKKHIFKLLLNLAYADDKLKKTNSRKPNNQSPSLLRFFKYL